MNDYYDVSIKEYRLEKIENLAKNRSVEWIFIKGNIADMELIDKLFEENGFTMVVNLAAQAGVRYSITNPDVYIESNIIGFIMFLRHADIIL
jgi:dTDP-D-glucose 4,6-dehydratase